MPSFTYHVTAEHKYYLRSMFPKAQAIRPVYHSTPTVRTQLSSKLFIVVLCEVKIKHIL